MGTLRFEIRIDKADKDGAAPIRLLYQIKGQRIHYSTGLKCFPANWDIINQRFIWIDKKTAKQKAPSINYILLLTVKEAESENNKLAELRKQVIDIEKRFELDKIPYDAEMIVSKLKETQAPTIKKTEPRTFFFDFIEQYIRDHESSRKKSSLGVYRSMKRHLKDFEKEKRKRTSFNKIDYAFLQSFQNFLISRTKTIDGKVVPAMNNITIAKQLSTIKTFLNYAKLQGIEVSENYKNFKIKRETLEVIALTNKEFESLFYLDIKNKKLAQVRDVFCFSCSTGLRYSDLKQLKREHIKDDVIKLTIEKTKEPSITPLNAFSRHILSNYQSQLKPLPVISNQRMNEYLKDLCKLAGINDPVEIVRFRGTVRESQIFPKYELVTVHTGRKTFVTLSLEKGMSAEVVMATTGHKDYRSFQRYVKITEDRKKTAMLKAWDGQISDVKLKAV